MTEDRRTDVNAKLAELRSVIMDLIEAGAEDIAWDYVHRQLAKGRWVRATPSPEYAILHPGETMASPGSSQVSIKVSAYEATTPAVHQW